MIGDRVGLRISGNTHSTLLRVDPDNQRLAILVLADEQCFANMERRRAVRRPLNRPGEPSGNLPHCAKRNHAAPPSRSLGEIVSRSRLSLAPVYNAHRESRKRRAYFRLANQS